VVLYLQFLVSVGQMPHSHSPLARELRAQRARERGFLQARPPGHRHVLVAEPLFEPVRRMVSSLELHKIHAEMSGRAWHYARDASLAVKDQIGEQELSRSLKVHSAANTAKHEVSKEAGATEVSMNKHKVRDSAVHDWCGLSPVVRKLEFSNSPTGAEIGQLAKDATQEKGLVQRIIQSQANLLLRMRSTEKLHLDLITELRGTLEQVRQVSRRDAVDDLTGLSSKSLKWVLEKMSTMLLDSQPFLMKPVLELSRLVDERMQKVDGTLAALQEGLRTVRDNNGSCRVLLGDAVVHPPEGPLDDRPGPRRYRFARLAVDRAPTDETHMMNDECDDECDDVCDDATAGGLSLGAVRRGPRRYRFVRPELPTPHAAASRASVDYSRFEKLSEYDHESEVDFDDLFSELDEEFEEAWGKLHGTAPSVDLDVD